MFFQSQFFLFHKISDFSPNTAVQHIPQSHGGIYTLYDYPGYVWEYLKGYLISNRLFKDEKKLKLALEILEEKHLGNIVEFLQENLFSWETMIASSAYQLSAGKN